MRKFFFAALLCFAFSFSLFAQDSTDLYQQYLNQYKNNNNSETQNSATAAPAKAEPEKKEEAAAQPAAEEKKEEPAQPAAEEKKEEPAQPAAEEKKEEPAQPAAEEKKEEPAQPAEAAAPAKEDVKIAPFEVKPFFSLDAFTALSNSIYVFGGDVLPHSSYRFGIDNAVVDLKGGNNMFNGRILFDLAKGFTTSKDVEINYDHDSEIPTDAENPLEYVSTSDSPNALDILKDVSFSMTHPSFRNAAGTFGLNVNLQAGLFGLPFGVEGGYDHEITFANSAIKEEFLGGAFRDIAVSLGFDFLFANNMDLALTLFVFNGKNETMLDGEDHFKDPALGFDLRYKYDSKFYITAAFSFVIGSAYIGYDEETKGGIFDTTNDTYIDSHNKIEENHILKDDNGRNDYAANKKNILFAIGTDFGYNVNDDVAVGFKGEFAYSHRDIFNPYANIEVNGQYFEDLRFIRDGNEGMIWGKGSYSPWGFFVMPYAHVYWFDIMARFSYFKQPYLYTFIEDSKNTNMGVDFALIYNFCDYAGVEFDYNFVRETRHMYDEAYSKDEYYTNTYNHHIFTIALTGWFDFLWEGKEDNKSDAE